MKPELLRLAWVVLLSIEKMQLSGYVSIIILLLLLPRPFSAALQSACVTEAQQTISLYLCLWL